MEDTLFTKREDLPQTAAMTEDEIVSAAKGIDPRTVATEIAQWLSDNVENYVDNHRKTYRLYLTIGATGFMPETGLLQKLYMSIPSVTENDDSSAKEVESRCLDVLDNITGLVKEQLVSDRSLCDKLYERLIYYYEMTGFSSQSGPIVQQFDGYIEVSEFVYEPISMEVVVSSGEDIVDVDGNHVGESKPKTVLRREVMPEGFSVDFEIKFWKKPAISPY